MEQILEDSLRTGSHESYYYVCIYLSPQGLCDYESISEAAVLSTCNRFEIYLSGQNQYECIRDAVNYLEKRAGGALDQATLRKSLFMLSGEDAIWHLLKVGAGLDSLIVGEGQILAQVKRAYEHGIEETGQSGKVVSRMLNTAVTAGKRVRTETGISKGAVSISSAAAEFTALKIQGDCGIQRGLEGANIAIIGAGKMARLLLVHLETQGVQKVTIINRSADKVVELRKEFPEMTIELELMDKMWDVIQNSDVVYPSTSATTTIIDREPLIECLKGRLTRPGGIQFIDISVPRNVAADCADIPGVFSYNVDDLKAVVERNTAKRRREMLEAEGILREELSKYRLWQQSLGAIPTIAKLQEKAENMRLEELTKASKKLSNLSAKDLEAVDRLSKGIIAKLLHGPMNHLRQQKEGDATRAAIQQVQQAFQLLD
jgi:glutamyl-tRNA reductase